MTGIEGRLAYRFVKRASDVAFGPRWLVAFCWLFSDHRRAHQGRRPEGPGALQSSGAWARAGRRFRCTSSAACADAEERSADLCELNEKTGPVFKMAEDPRVTRVAGGCASVSLDELPQFINVLAGDMSTVGPRPALPAEVATYNDYQRQRLLVKPGLTCYWQTRRNRDSITFDEWVDLDLLYIKQCSPWADFKLIVQTVGVVLTAQGS